MLKAAFYFCIAIDLDLDAWKLCDFISGVSFVIAFGYRFALFWVIFSLILGGKNWVLPYQTRGLLQSVREHGASQFFRQNHLAFHAVK